MLIKIIFKDIKGQKYELFQKFSRTSNKYKSTIFQ